MPENTEWIQALRRSHDRLSGLLGLLSSDEVTGPSYDDDWTIADVASHLGSQAEIFDLFLDAGLAGAGAPGGDSFPPIWDRWNAMPPQEQVASSISANESFVRRVESLSADEQDRFSLDLFGIQADLGGLAAMRLGEHALHTWDVAVMADPTAEVPADEVALLVDTVSLTAGRAAAPVDGAGVFAIKTTAPERSFVVDGGAGALLEVAPADATTLTMPAEAFVRLVYGRLDDRHTPDTVAAPDDALDVLRTVFPGF